MWKWRVVFWSNSLLCCLSRTVLPYFLRKNTRNLFIIWTIALYLLLLVYIYLKHDRNFTILGHSLNTREFILKCSVTIRKVWPHSNCNQHVNVVQCHFSDLLLSRKAPCKRKQQCWPTTSNIVGCYMLRPFAHPVACCCVLLGVVAQSLKPVKLLAASKRTQQLPTLLANNVGSCCVCLHAA